MFFKDKKSDGSQVLPLLPLRDLVVFPYMVVPLIVGREKSIAALNEANRAKEEIFLAAQRKARTNDPEPEDIFEYGTTAAIMQMIRLPDGTVKVLVEGRRRAKIERYLNKDDIFRVEITGVDDSIGEGVEIEALMRSVKTAFEHYVKLNKSLPPEMLLQVSATEEPGKLSDTLVPNLNIKLEERQRLLETADPSVRLERLLKFLQSEIEILQVERKIKSRVKKQMEKSQKEYYLNEQMQAIQKELGEKDEFRNELQELEQRIADKDMSEEATDKISRELRKLKLMSPMSAEATVVRNYIDTILSLPWYEYSAERLDIANAARVLDEDTTVSERSRNASSSTWPWRVS